MDGLRFVPHDSVLWRGKLSEERRLLLSLASTSARPDEEKAVSYLGSGIVLDQFRGTDVTGLDRFHRVWSLLIQSPAGFASP